MTETIGRILAIDPGSVHCGIVILEDGRITLTANLSVSKMFDLVDQLTLFSGNMLPTIVYEDIRPYTSRFDMNTIKTCKIIGKLEDRLEQRRVAFKGITRNEVKAFVFTAYPGAAIPMIEKKIIALEKKTKKGKNYRPSFHYVDDRIVKAGMRVHWKIPIPKPGKPSLYNLKDHAWQALGTLTCYLHQLEKAALGTF